MCLINETVGYAITPSPIRWKGQGEGSFIQKWMAFLALLPPVFPASFDRQPGAADSLPCPAPSFVCQSAHRVLTEIEFA